MTPKEKAAQLYNKCNPHCLTKSFYGDDIERQSTKQCAIIAVDEMFEFMKIDDFESDTLYFANSKWVQYWQQVKTEIENL